MNKITIINTCLIIALLLTGALIWADFHKRKADRSACRLNIRNMHQAVRAHHGLQGLDFGDPLDWSKIFSTTTSENYLEEPLCPSDGSRYILSPIHPKVGVPAAKCPNCDTLDHRHDDTSGW